MNWFDTLVENIKIFWNQPVPIIGFSVGMVIVGACFIISKTQFGKKKLNQLSELVKKAVNEMEQCKKALLDTNNKFVEYKANKEQEIKDLTNNYETKLSAYKGELDKINGILESICDNSHNVNVKNAYENYVKDKINVDLLPTSEIIKEAENNIKSEYDEKLNSVINLVKELEVKVYGEERPNTTTTSE